MPASPPPLPPFSPSPSRLFLEVMGVSGEYKVGEGKEKKGLGTRQMLCGLTDIFALLSS